MKCRIVIVDIPTGEWVEIVILNLDWAKRLARIVSRDPHLKVKLISTQETEVEFC